MNNKVGLQNLFDHKEALTLMARSITPTVPLVMLEAVKLMAAVCLVPPDGHDKTLEAITIAGEVKQRERFQPIIQGLLIRNNEPLRVACLTLINALISSPEDIDFRIHLRNEFMRDGLIDVLEALESDNGEELQLQLKVFNEHKEEDFDEFAQRFDNIRLELDDVNECFELVKNLVLDTPAEPYFLSVLQHMVCIRDDIMVRPAYFKLIEECVSQIVLHKSGCDPDFRATKRFNIDVEPLIEQLVERGRLEDAASIGASMGMTAGLEAAITEKQETEAKLAHAEMRIKQLEEAVKNGGGVPGPLANGIQAVASIIRPGGGPPPPPPPPGGAGLPPPPPPPPGMGGPPPPPPPGPGGPPPPPPPGGAPPPPPPFGTPRPPGAPGPPGPLAAPAAVDVLAKLGMKRKKKWTVEGQIKRTNWKAVPLTKLTEKAFWTNVDEEQLASQSLIEEIQNKFSSRPPAGQSKFD